MSKGKKVKVVESYMIRIAFDCPHCGTRIKRNVDCDDFTAHEDSCGMCGSYGEIMLDTNTSECPRCHGKLEAHIELRSW